MISNKIFELFKSRKKIRNLKGHPLSRTIFLFSNSMTDSSSVSDFRTFFFAFIFSPRKYTWHAQAHHYAIT